MTIKQFLKNSIVNGIIKNNDKMISNFQTRFGIVIYSVIFIAILVVYIVTLNSINNQKSENEKNLVEFFETGRLLNIKQTLFNNLNNPYLEFKYNIEMNDSIGKILRKL